jgi:hypothetical protein
MEMGFSTMTRRFNKMLMLALSLGAAAWATPSFADQDCAGDMQKLAQRRESELAKINAVVKAAHGKQLDPAVFCSQSGGLNTVETAMIAYMEKNKDWCQIPDEAIGMLKANHAKSVAFTAKACGVAAKIKKMQQDQAAGGGPQVQPLPAGPL